MLIIKRVCRIMALLVVYMCCGYMYLTEKGFVRGEDKFFVLSKSAIAEENQFSRPVDGKVLISEANKRVKGNADAPLTMFIFSSMSCAHCQDFHKFTLPKIERDFVTDGKLKLSFIHFPLEERSMRAAKLSYCLPKEYFYDFINELYGAKDWLFAEKEDKLYEYAKKYGMTDEDIVKCNENKKLTSDILMTRDDVVKTFGITGTPSFIVEGSDGSEVISGSKGYDSLKKYLEKRLKGENNAR